MNAVTSANRYNQTAYLYASDPPGNIATILKPTGIVMRVLLDYSHLSPPIANITAYAFFVDVGSNPPLAVTLNAVSGSVLDFLVSGGVEGMPYVVTINVNSARDDTITINVPLDGCGCGAASVPTVGNDASYPVGEGMVFINSSPKYIVSTTQPTGCNIMDQWFNPATLSLDEYVTDGTNYWWQELVETAPRGPVAFTTVHLSPIVPDGHTTQFTLTASTVGVVNIMASTDLLVSVDGVWQEPETQYLAYSNQLQFFSAPTADSKIFMVWLEH